MLGYVTLGTNDMARGAAFYDALLAEFGAKRCMETDRYIAWGFTNGQMICLIKPYNGGEATVGNGMMVSLGAASRAQVDAVYGRAMALGAADEGAAGPRGDDFYAGYFRDLDGNKLAVYFAG
jgi:predicted lactoylglutathione lyase